MNAGYMHETTDFREAKGGVPSKPHRIVIERKAHKDMRYDTCGDYYFDEIGDLHIDIVEMGNELSEIAVAAHELMEEYSTRKKGLLESDIKAYDEEHWADDGPGENKDAPYHPEHMNSNRVEKFLLKLYKGLSWKKHQQLVMDSCEGDSK